METPSLFEHLWPQHQPTSLLTLPALARLTQVRQVLIKCEGERPLGSFKVLGGMTAAVRAIARHAEVSTSALLSRQTPIDARLICATDGNHGLAVAAAAARCGIEAHVYLPRSASALRARRIDAQGARLVQIDGTYDDAVIAAREAAQRGEGLLIADTSERDDDEIVSDVLAGYEVLTTELRSQLRQPIFETPSHVFVQAGVGGLAAAIARGLITYIDGTKLIIVEPAAAACVAEGLKQAVPVRIPGSLETTAEMLSCGIASASALAILRRYPVECLSLTEHELVAAPETLTSHGGPRTTTSGAAGVAGLLAVGGSRELRERFELTRESRILLIVTEDLAEEN
jgi:diaminopropionate ammonia-lyase